MDGISPDAFGQRYDPVDIEIRTDRLTRAADFVGFVRFESVKCVTIFVSVNGDGADSEFRGAAENSNRNFGTITDEQFLKR
jgi:hypothetical protein